MKNGKFTPCPKPEPKEKKKRVAIRKLSVKREKENKEYLKLRAEYLAENTICEVKGCLSRSTDCHHRAGRTCRLLTDKNYFMAVCRKCHTKIEMEVEWSKKMGYSLNRI